MNSANTISNSDTTLRTRGEQNYRFDHFTLPLMLQDLRFSGKSLRAGDTLPDLNVLLSVALRRR